MPSTIGPTEVVILELLMLMVPVILLVVLFYVVRGAVKGGVSRALGGLQTFGAGDPPAEEVLRRRYAGGELTREEYLNIRVDISRNPDA